ncbi:MAG: S8 family serine peptidase, partial [Roseiflexaceae bacterium]
QQDARVANVATQVRQIESEGNADDVIPVIVTLVNPYGDGNVIQPRSTIAVRKSQVRNLQSGFAGRQAGRMTVNARQPENFPIVGGKIRRSDVALMARDTAVLSIQEDKPVPVAMDESTVIIGSYDANQSGYGGLGMTVAVLDTGVKTDHEFLSGQVVAEACFSNASGYGTGTSLCPSGTSTTNSTSNDVGSATPCGYGSCDHGTHVAGTIAGKVTPKSGYTLRGVAPNAKIIGVQVFTYFAESGSIGSYPYDQVLAMDWLYDNMSTPSWGTLAALNMSLGGGESTTTCDSSNGSLKTYIDALRTRGVATVIASGNDGWSDKISSPACISSAIAVGATTSSSAIGYGGHTAVDQVAYFSNAPTSANNSANGNGDRLLDLLAPGFFIYSATSASTTAYDYKAGTSMATPHVAGAWAVMKQAAPTASVSQILQWLYASGTSITDSRNSLILPRINVDDAVTLALAAASATATPTSVSGATSTPIPPTSTPIPPTSTRTRTPIPRPGAFRKLGPANRQTNRQLRITLSWTASAGAARYEYCLSTVATRCNVWKSVGTSRSVTIRGLQRNKTYYWNVRARNSAGVTLSNGGVWRFRTIR